MVSQLYCYPIKGCMLRVQRQTVELGARLDGGTR